MSSGSIMSEIARVSWRVSATRTLVAPRFGWIDTRSEIFRNSLPRATNAEQTSLRALRGLRFLFSGERLVEFYRLNESRIGEIASKAGRGNVFETYNPYECIDTLCRDFIFNTRAGEVGLCERMRALVPNVYSLPEKTEQTFDFRNIHARARVIRVESPTVISLRVSVPLASICAPSADLYHLDREEAVGVSPEGRKRVRNGPARNRLGIAYLESSGSRKDLKRVAGRIVRQDVGISIPLRVQLFGLSENDHAHTRSFVGRERLEKYFSNNREEFADMTVHLGGFGDGASILGVLTTNGGEEILNTRIAQILNDCTNVHYQAFP